MIEFALFIQTLIYVVIVVAFVRGRNSSFFHPLGLYLIFHLLVFVIRPLLVHFAHFGFIWWYMEYEPTETEFVRTLLLSTFGLLCFSISVWYGGRCSARFGTTGLPKWTIAEKRAFVVVALFLGPFAIYSGVNYVEGASFEGIGDIQMTKDIATGIAIYTNTTGYIAEAHAMLGALCILFLWRNDFRAWAYGPFIFFIAYRAFLGWGRWSIITSLLSLAMIYLYRNNILWPRVRWLIIAIPFAVLFQNLGMDRDLIRDYVDNIGVSNRLAVEPPRYVDNADSWSEFDHPDFANFDFLAYVIWAVPDKSNTFTYFSQYLQLFTEPIPRIIWAEKPIGQPLKLFDLNDFGNFRGMTVSLVGDGWMSFGWLGTMITMVLVGLFLGRLHKAFWRNQESPRVVMAYCIFLPLTITWFRDGGISIFKFALFTLTPILMWSFLSRLIAQIQQPKAALRRRGPPPLGMGPGNFRRGDSSSGPPKPRL